MKRFLVALGLVFCLVGASLAQAQVCPGVIGPVKPMEGAYQSITVADTAVGLTVPLHTELAVAVLETASVRYRDDGTDPTSSEGLLINAGGNVIICSQSLGSVRFIRATGTSGTLKVAYYGR